MIGSGIAAGLAGMLYDGRMHSGRYTFGEGDELSVIIAVILLRSQSHIQVTKK
jgi:ribose transport system permease protein